MTEPSLGELEARRPRQLAPQEVEKVRAELARYEGFATLSEQIVEVNEAICEARPATPPAGGHGLEAVELAIRTVMARLGTSLLEGLLAADAGTGRGLIAGRVIRPGSSPIGPRPLRPCWGRSPSTGRTTTAPPARVRAP